MKRWPAERIGDLVPAARAIRDDEVVGSGAPESGKQGQLRHRQRDIDVLDLVAESSGAPTTARCYRANIEAGNSAQHRLDGGHGAERFLMAVAVKMRDTGALVLQRKGDLAAPCVLRQAFLEQQGGARYGLRFVCREDDRKLVAQGRDTGRLKADDSRTPLDIGG